MCLPNMPGSTLEDDNDDATLAKLQLQGDRNGKKPKHSPKQAGLELCGRLVSLSERPQI